MEEDDRQPKMKGENNGSIPPCRKEVAKKIKNRIIETVKLEHEKRDPGKSAINDFACNCSGSWTSIISKYS